MTAPLFTSHLTVLPWLLWQASVYFLQVQQQWYGMTFWGWQVKKQGLADLILFDFYLRCRLALKYTRMTSKLLRNYLEGCQVIIMRQQISLWVSIHILLLSLSVAISPQLSLTHVSSEMNKQGRKLKDEQTTYHYSILYSMYATSYSSVYTEEKAPDIVVSASLGMTALAYCGLYSSTKWVIHV